MTMRALVLLPVFTCCSLLFSGCTEAPAPAGQGEGVKQGASRTFENRLGTLFEEISPAHFKAPNIEALNILNGLPGAVIWGATGRDDSGNIYIGVSTYEGSHNNAYLYQYNPITQVLVAQGNVLDQLKKAQLYKEGMSQTTLHSKIYMADDGYLYFTSLDTLRTSLSTKALPANAAQNASYLWRKKPQDADWEHLLTAQESLVALHAMGRYVYAMGSPGHVLYQYDTLSRRFNRITAGSQGDHISRNFLLAKNGNVFLPRVQTLSNGETATDILEYNNRLDLVDIHPIDYYYAKNKFSPHGILSYATMKNGDIYFMTGQGALYQLSGKNSLKHELSFITFLDEAERPGNYVSSLFSPDGETFIAGLGRLDKSSNYRWFIHELDSELTVAYNIPEFSTNYLLYGSATRDNLGNFYIGGVNTSNPQQNKVALLRVSYSAI